MSLKLTKPNRKLKKEARAFGFLMQSPYVSQVITWAVNHSFHKLSFWTELQDLLLGQSYNISNNCFKNLVFFNFKQNFL